MILAIDRHGALYVFSSTTEAETSLEAIDVKQDLFEFADNMGQRYTPIYTQKPSITKLIGPINVIDIGLFKLVPEGDASLDILQDIISRSKHLEHSSISSIDTIASLETALNRSA